MFVCSLFNAFNCLQTQKSVSFSFAVCLLLPWRHNTNQASVFNISYPCFVSWIQTKEVLTFYWLYCWIRTKCEYIYKCLFISNKVTNNWHINMEHMAVKCASIDAEHRQLHNITYWLLLSKNVGLSNGNGEVYIKAQGSPRVVNISTYTFSC